MSYPPRCRLATYRFTPRVVSSDSFFLIDDTVPAGNVLVLFYRVVNSGLVISDLHRSGFLPNVASRRLLVRVLIGRARWFANIDSPGLRKT